MTKPWYLRASVLLALVCLGRMPNATPLRVEASGGLVFEVLPVQKEIPVGKPVYLKFNLRNTGTEKVLVNRRFYLDDIVTLEITGPSGNNLSWCGHIRQIEVSAGDFVFLAPDAHVEKVVQVSCNENKTLGYTISEPGQYVIKAQYQLPFPTEVLEKAAHGAVVDKGPIPAHVIQITIVNTK
jgi:hypothetical protein